jgi:hypothetical protein
MDIARTFRTSLASAGLAAATTVAGAASLSAQVGANRPATGNQSSAVSNWDTALTAPQTTATPPVSQAATNLFAALSNGETKVAAFDSITPELLDEPSVVIAVVSTLGDTIVPLSQPSADQLLNSPTFTNYATRLSLEQHFLENPFLWHNLLSSCSPETAIPFIPKAASDLATVYAMQPNTSQREDMMLITASCLRSEPALRQAFAEMLDRSPESVKLLEQAASFGVSSQRIFSGAAELFDALDETTRTTLTPLLLRHITVEGLQNYPEIHPTILGELSRSPSVWPTGPLLQSDAFSEMICAEIRRDPAFIRNIPPVVWSKDSATVNEHIRNSMLTAASSFEKDWREELIVAEGLSASPIPTLLKIPLISLEDPATRQLVREACSTLLLRQGSFENNVSLTEHSFITELASAVPEILRLPLSRKALSELPPSCIAELVAINPGAFSNITPKLSSVSIEGLQSLVRSISAFEALGIRGLNRFDNGREILRNRYAVADSATQARLEDLLSAEYFAGVASDTRPYAVIVTANEEADHNHVFHSFNDISWRDYIDRLTDYYRVVLVEGSDQQDVVDVITAARDKAGVRAELLLILGHGSEESITLSHERITPEVAGQLAELMLPGGAIALCACSTAKAPKSGQPSLHSVFAKTFPNCRVFAPSDDSPLPRMILSRFGKFERVDFPNNLDHPQNISTVEYDPHSQTVTRTPGVSVYRELLGNFTNQFYNSLLIFTGGLVSGVVALQALKVTGNFLRGSARLVFNIPGAVREANRLGKQPLLFPAIRDTWVIRFLGAVWNGPSKTKESESTPSE